METGDLPPMMEELTLHTQGSSSQPAAAAEKPALRAVESGGKYYVQQLLEVMRSDGTWSKVRGLPPHATTPVSYTHLTLPTICSV